MFQDVLRAYRDALTRWLPFVTAHLFIRLVVSALLVPVIGLALGLTLSFSNQTALTDQDIARFLLTPAGFIGALVVLSLIIIALVLDVVVGTVILRQKPSGPVTTMRLAADYTLHAVPRLVPFMARLVLRLLALILPFAAVAGGIALLLLTEFDINYYLTEQPPEFLRAVVLIGLVLLGLAGVLLATLSGWAIALHLALFQGLGARQAFEESTRQMAGHRLRLILRLLLWAGIRLLAASAAAALGAACVGWLTDTRASDLEALVFGMVVGTALYFATLAVVNALSNGALAGLFNAEFDRAIGQTPPAFAVEAFAARAGTSRRSRLVLGLVALLSLVSLGTGGVVSNLLKPENVAEIIAHRGAAAHAPENTLASVRRAIADGADWIEIDVQEDADGTIIVAHDSDFMKAAGVATKVWDVTEADLAQIDVGTWFDPAFSDERVPRLDAVLAIVEGRAKLLIELKYYGHDEALEARVADLVIAAGMQDQIATMSLKYQAVQKMRALQPGWRSGVLAATSVGDLSGLDGDFLALNQSAITPGVVRRAEAAGKDVYAWTVNDPASIGRMLWVGVDGLITDDPALAREVMQRYNALSVGERLVLALADRLSLTLDPERIQAARP